MMHDTELLQYVYKTTDMGSKGIESVENYIQSTALKDKLKEQKVEYQKLRDQAKDLLAARNEHPKGVSPIAEASADVMAAGKMITTTQTQRLQK